MAGRFREIALDSRGWPANLAFTACGSASRFEGTIGSRSLVRAGQDSFVSHEIEWGVQEQPVPE